MIFYIVEGVIFFLCAVNIYLCVKLISMGNSYYNHFTAHQKWLFNSLYSINQTVLLPEEHEKPMSTKKVYVYDPGADPMAEFNGNKDDFYGD